MKVVHLPVRNVVSGSKGLRNTPIHICRIRYFGNEDRWSFAWYTYAHEAYEPAFLITGADQGTPEEAFETAALFL